jgi:hypothetical protein
MSETMQPTDVKACGEARHISLLSQLGLVAAVAALVGSACCAFSLALAWLGLAGAWIASLGIFVIYRPYTIAGALIVVGLGWAIAIRRRAAARTYFVLGLASLVVGGAILVSYYETELTRYLIALQRK